MAVGRFWRLMGGYDAETNAYSACAYVQASPWTPDFNGRLVGLRTQASYTAATSLVGNIQFRIGCTNFSPNSIECYAQGGGLATVPANISAPIDFAVDQPIVAGVPITVEGRCNDMTPVTVQAYLYGLFQGS